MDKIKEMRQRVHSTIVKASNEGLMAGTSGNASEYDRESGLMVVTPTNIGYDVLTTEDLVVMKLDGDVVEGKYNPSSEWKLHAEMYKNIEGVNGVIHTHSPYATGFAITGEMVPLILVEMLPFLGGDVPVAEFGMPGTPDVGLNAVKVMTNRNAALLSNHGVVAVGRDSAHAYIRAVYVEDAAKAYHFAKLMGTPRLIDEEAADVLRKKYNLKK